MVVAKMIRTIVLGAALLFAGEAWAADFTCEGTVKQCAEILSQSGLSTNEKPTPFCDEAPGATVCLERHYGKTLATKDDIDAINKRLDGIENILRCLDGAVRLSGRTFEPCR